MHVAIVPAEGQPYVITLMMNAARIADDSWLDTRCCRRRLGSAA